MSSLRALAKLMKDLEDQPVVCMRCDLCQAVCPLFAETGREADAARGKLALLDGLLQEILQNAGGVQDHLSRCLLCGSCAANCPSGVKVLDIFIKSRAILAGYLGLPPLKKAIFRHLLAKPGTFIRLLAGGPNSRASSSNRWTISWAPPAPVSCRRCSRTGISSPWPRSPGTGRWAR